MKKKIISVFIIGMFFAVGIFVTPAEKLDNSQSHEYTYLPADLYSSNIISIGEVYTVYEPDVLTGASNAQEINMTSSWVVNPGDTEAYGTLGMDIFDYNFQNEDSLRHVLSPFVKTTVCDYEFIVYDGPTSSDGMLTSGFSTMMGKGVKYEEKSHQFSVETKGQPSRTLAFDLNAKTQTYIPGLRMTIETESGSISKKGNMILNFITPQEKQQALQDMDKGYSAVNTDTINIDLGKIIIYTSDDPTYIPKCELVVNSYQDPYPVNQSEIITVNAHLDYELWITTKVHPRFFSFLNCQILISIHAAAFDSSQLYMQIPNSSRQMKKTLIKDTYIDNDTLSTSFTLDTSKFPAGCDFVINYFLSVPALFGSQPSGGKDRTAAIGKVNIRWIPN